MIRPERAGGTKIDNTADAVGATMKKLASEPNALITK